MPRLFNVGALRHCKTRVIRQVGAVWVAEVWIGPHPDYFAHNVCSLPHRNREIMDTTKQKEITEEQMEARKRLYQLSLDMVSRTGRPLAECVVEVARKWRKEGVLR